MKDSSFSLENGKDLYIRMPETIEGLDVMRLSLPKDCAGKTLKITVIENEEAPFERDAIWAKDHYCDLNFYGNNEYWQSVKCTRTVVEANPRCDFEECTSECHDISCPVYQGYEPCTSKKITYWRSNKVK